jgi:hypothetical protein
MNRIIGAFAATAFVGLACAPLAHAQSTPQGSYLRSCANAHVEGDTLVARCRTENGREDHAVLGDLGRCHGDIANINGRLVCNHADGRSAGYGSSLPPRDDRCEGLHREARDLRDRMAASFNPIERAQLEGRLHELREREDRCR